MSFRPTQVMAACLGYRASCTKVRGGKGGKRERVGGGGDEVESPPHAYMYVMSICVVSVCVYMDLCLCVCVYVVNDLVCDIHYLEEAVTLYVVFFFPVYLYIRTCMCPLYGDLLGLVGGDVYTSLAHAHTHTHTHIHTHTHTQTGAHPMSKLVVMDSRFPVTATVYAYSRYKVGDMNTSATPAVAFTAILENPLNETLTASFMFNFPHGIEPHTQRAFPQMSDNEWEEGSALPPPGTY